MNVLLPSGSAESLVGIGRKSCRNTESLVGIGRKSRRDTEGLAAVKKVSME